MSTRRTPACANDRAPGTSSRVLSEAFRRTECQAGVEYACSAWRRIAMASRGALLLGLALALTLSLAAPGWADDTVEVGIGHRGCREALKILRATESRDRTLLGQWSQGYLSGRNALTPPDLAACRRRYRPLPEMEAMMKWLEQYCGRNPDHGFIMANDVLFDSLPKRELRIPDCRAN